jgi:hypothetical protein
MTRARVGLLGLCVAVLGLMALAASSASAAPEWLILDGKAVPQTAAKLPVTVVSEAEKSSFAWLFKLVGINAKVLCTVFTYGGAKLESGGTLTNGGSFTLTGCTVPMPAGNICTVKSPGSAVGTIVTKELKGALQTSGEVLIEPKTGTVFAELVFEGKECTLPEGAQALNGVLWLKDCENEAETHLIKHLMNESKVKFRKNAKGELTLGTLWMGKDTEEHLEISSEGSWWWFLAGAHANLPWSFMLV